jgi:predicted PurR-regulated permease PerM
VTEPRKVPYNVILAAIWLTVASAASIALVYKWRALIFHLVIAAFFALVLNPAVKRLERAGMSRGPAILVVVILAFLSFAGLIAAVAAPITSQGVNFAKHAPQFLQQAQQGRGPLAAFARKFHLDKELTKAEPAISRTLAKVPSEIVGVLRSAASTAFSVATVAILAIFMLIEGPSLISAFLAAIPDSKREQIRLVGTTTSRVVSGYTLGVVGLGILNGAVTAISLSATGVPFVTSLAVWAGLVDVLPIIGGLIAIVSAGLFAFAHSLVSGIIVVAVMLGYQQVKNHVLYPVAVGRAVRLNALLVMVAVLAGSELMGIPGALLAIPVAGALHAIIVEFAPDPARAFLRHPDLSGTPAPAGVPSGVGADAVGESTADNDGAADHALVEEARTARGSRLRRILNRLGRD